MKCSKCVGRGYWNVFAGNTVNGAKEENELIKQTCDKCDGKGMKG
jgi:hypothetical protein